MINDADRRFIEALGPAIRRLLWLRFDTPGATTKGVVIQVGLDIGIVLISHSRGVRAYIECSSG